MILAIEIDGRVRFRWRVDNIEVLAISTIYMGKELD